jgi:hypothetical protein
LTTSTAFPHPKREKCRKAEAKFVKARNRFFDTLDGLDANERYDAIVDEIDRVAKDADVTFLWGIVRAASRDGDYAGSKRRALRHLCRKLGLENSVLPALENMAKTLAEVKEEREELIASDKPYREVTAALTALDLKEKETLDSLEECGVDLSELSGDGGEVSGRKEAEDTFVDKLGDAAVEVIRGVTDGIEGVLNGFTGALTRLM